MNETQRRFAARRELWDKAFEGIDLQGKAVLDAGSGEGHFARFLAERNPGRILSVTCLEKEIPAARERLGELADRVEFVIADLTCMPEIPDAAFDVVGADFLIAAVATYRPYCEIECLKELKRVLKPGGRLVVTGWEVWPECRNRTERIIRRLSKLRDGIHHLLGEEPFREHPRFWVENRLAELGMPPEQTCKLPDVHRDFSWFVRNLRKAVASLEPEGLRAALEAEVDGLEGRLRSDPAFEVGFEFGALYAVTACKLEGAILLG